MWGCVSLHLKADLFLFQVDAWLQANTENRSTHTVRIIEMNSLGGSAA